MDNVTHALAGVLMGEAAAAWVARTPRVASSGIDLAVVRRAAITIGVIGAELPDSDLFYSGDVLNIGQLGYLLHHRGHTHTVLFALVSGVIMWLIATRLGRSLRHPAISRTLLALSIAATLSHVLLDWTNNYGVHPFWPVDNRWYYGDAIFIIEPWLWIVALPPLFMLARSRVARALYIVLGVAILAACWMTGMLTNALAAFVTVAAIAWAFASSRMAVHRLVPAALIGWVIVEGAFMITTAKARAIVGRAVGPTLVDAVVTPGPANPFCTSALVATLDGDTWSVSTASVTPIGTPSTRWCTGRTRAPLAGPAASLEPSPQVRWGTQWTASAGELRQLARQNCHVAAALQFIRIPQWRVQPDARVEIWDARFGEGGFAGIVAPPAGASCPRFVPGWTPPRQDVLSRSGA